MNNELQNQWDQGWEKPRQDPVPDTALTKMGWHKFLIYFALWAGAVMNIISAVGMFTGTIYEGAADMVYMAYPALHIVDLLYGGLLCALAFWMIYTRFALAKFRKPAPRMLNLVYIFAVSLSWFYSLTAAMLTGLPILEALASLVGSTISSALMILINTNYYRKRMHLFTNP